MTELLPHCRSFGGLLPRDAMQRILATAMPGMKDADYVLAGERKREAIDHAFTRMLRVWQEFDRLETRGTAQTRSRLLLPLFDLLGYGHLSLAKPEERLLKFANEREISYPISHFRDESPIHLVGWDVELDSRKARVAGAATQSPHSLVQTFLNNSPSHSWGFVSNGQKLRILRKSGSLFRSACIEFDLAEILACQSPREFALLWLVCHHSRLHMDNDAECWLEVWCREAAQAGVAALDHLRNNVEGAIEHFGQGFLDASPALAQRLANGSLSLQDYFWQLLRFVYRLIFLLALESRDALHREANAAQRRYFESWSLTRLVNLAMQTKGSPFYSDLWQGLEIVMATLAGENQAGEKFLGLAPLGGPLWSRQAMRHLDRARLANASLLAGLRKLAWLNYEGQKRPVDWQSLGAREFGSVYESLLELQPLLKDGKFSLAASIGNERKTTGSYYTPDELIESLLQTSLEPVIQNCLKAEDPEAALLDLKICDPACGSGHFLLAAGKKLALSLASLRNQDSEPSPQATAKALREIAGRCLYGIDINFMAVELCKIGLWLETHEPGKPLPFLEHHFIHANSLLGATPEAVANGIPDAAYKALAGDDKKALSQLKKLNRIQRERANSEGGLLDSFRLWKERLNQSIQSLDLAAMPDNTLADIEEQQKALEAWRRRPEWVNARMLFDLWCSAFVIKRRFPEGGERAIGVTWETLIDAALRGKIDPALHEESLQASREYQFFHPFLMFPEVAQKGGFDVILGNPPWERIKLQKKEWFANHSLDQIVNAANAAERDKMIDELCKTDSVLASEYEAALRRAEAFSYFLRASGLFPNCGRGDINLYAVFAEWMRNNLNENGRLGCIVPSGIACDDTNKIFFQDLVKSRSLHSLHDFENGRIFPGVHASYKFCLLTCGSGAKKLADQASFVFFAHNPEDIDDERKRFTLTPADIALLNPNTLTCPVFAKASDATLTKAVYRRMPVFWREASAGRREENPWQVQFATMFNMSTDSHRFRTQSELSRDGWQLNGNIFEKDDSRYLPLYEAKMMSQFEHRWASYQEIKGELKTLQPDPADLANPDYAVLPRYWLSEGCVEEKLEAQRWPCRWLMGWRNITNATNSRAILASILPVTAAGHSINQVFAPTFPECLLASFNSCCLDYITRQKIGGLNLNFFLIRQLPIPAPEFFGQACPWQPELTLAEWIRARALELVYTTHDLRPFAEDMGYDGEPFAYAGERREALRAELDATFFHIYLPCLADGGWAKARAESDAEFRELVAQFPTPKAATEYILAKFKSGAKAEILANYGAMQARMASLGRRIGSDFLAQ